MQRMQGKVCIVTGSSSGLGRAISLTYAKEGGLVICADLKPEARPDVESELRANTHDLIRESGGLAIFVQTDVTKPEQVERLVQRAVEEYGRLDV
jgi:NAD(P)-dependent dehydrogenase (short-subunit alcohol dehydrogenase family)